MSAIINGRGTVGIRGLSVVGTPTDPDAQAFITAANITGTTQATAITTLVLSLKSYGIWTKMKAIYPFVGGTPSSHKWNLKDPRDLDAAFRLTFTAGWTHSSTGALPNGTSDYADTKLASNLVDTTNHLSFYSRTQYVSSVCEMGVWITGVPTIYHLRVASNYFSGAFVGSATSRIYFTTTTDARGFWLGTKRANNDRQVYYNGVSQGISTDTDNSLASSLTIFIGARNDDGVPYIHSNKECAFASIGNGLTDTDASNLYTAVQTYQTSLGRQV